MGNDKICISTEYPPVFAGVDGQSALSVEMPKCADEDVGEEIEEQLLDQVRHNQKLLRAQHCFN